MTAVETSSNGTPTSTSTSTTLQRFRADQMQVLKNHYDRNPRPSTEEIHAISAEVNESERKVRTWFSNWRSKNKKDGNPPPSTASTPNASQQQVSTSPVSTPAPQCSMTKTPVINSAPPSEASDTVVVVDSVKVRPPPKRVTNFTLMHSSSSALTPNSSVCASASSELSYKPILPQRTSYPPPPDPVLASSIPPEGISNILRLMSSSFFTPQRVSDFEAKRRRKIDDDDANDAVMAVKRANVSTPLPTKATAPLPKAAQPSPLVLPASSASSAAAASFLHKPKSAAELKNAAKLITKTLKKLKRGKNGELNAESALLLQQAKNLGLVPNEDSGSDSDTSSSRNGSSDSGSSGSSSSGSDNEMGEGDE